MSNAVLTMHNAAQKSERSRLARVNERPGA
jgi:hypothetical protein